MHVERDSQGLRAHGFEGRCMVVTVEKGEEERRDDDRTSKASGQYSSVSKSGVLVRFSSEIRNCIGRMLPNCATSDADGGERIGRRAIRPQTRGSPP